MTTATAETGPGERALDVDRLSVVLVGSTIALLPVATGWVLWHADGGGRDFNQRVSMSPFDWPLLLLVFVQLADVAERRISPVVAVRRLPTPVALLALTLAWMAVTALIHPSWRALDFFFHVAGAWALVRATARADRAGQNAVLAALVGLGVIQALIGIVQSRTGAAIGLPLLEFEGPLYTFGASSAGRGSLDHPYHLTALLVVCVAAAAVLFIRWESSRTRTFVLVATATIGAAIPLTFSRASVLSLVPMVALWAWRPSWRPVAVALAAGFVIGGAMGLDGIASKSGRSVDVEAADSGRRQRLEEAANLIESEPVFGVGTGRYVIGLKDVEHEELLPPHNIVAHAGAEAGVPGLILMAGAVLSFGWWLLRRDLPVVGVGVSLVPFHLLDSYPHVFPTGLTITGFWLATLVVAERTVASPGPSA